jgi:hypothetical protein
MAAPTNTKKDRQKIMDQANAAARKAEELSKSGGIPMDGMSPTGDPESTIGMSRNDRFFSQGRKLDESQREGYKTFGDKATGEGINKLRALQGLPAISNTPKEFSENINKSVGFGGESALLDQAGRDRALKSGIGAGLSYEEADAAVSKAYDFLKGKYGDKTTPTTPTTTPSPKSTPDTTPTNTISATPTLPPVVPVAKSPTMQFFSDFGEGVAEGGPERFLVKGGSAYMAEKARRAKLAADPAAKAAAKAGGAVTDTTKAVGKAGDVGARMRDTQAGRGAAGRGAAPKLVGKAGDVGARMRQTQAAKGAGGATTVAGEAAGAADEAAKAAGKGKGLFSPLIKGVANTSTGKAIAASGRGAGKGLRVFGRAAGPALEIYDAARYFTGDEEVKNQYAEDAATLGQRVFQPKSAGEFVGGLGDVLSPTKNVLGTTEAVSQMLKSQRGARESEAALANMENIYKAVDDRRREIYSDEEFAKLPRNRKEAVAAGMPEDTLTQGEVKNMIRNEFRKAGAKF